MENEEHCSEDYCKLVGELIGFSWADPNLPQFRNPIFKRSDRVTEITQELDNMGADFYVVLATVMSFGRYESDGEMLDLFWDKYFSNIH